MPLKFYLMVVGAAIVAAALTIGAASLVMPGEAWAGPATMAVLGGLALAAHFWVNRK